MCNWKKENNRIYFIYLLISQLEEHPTKDDSHKIRTGSKMRFHIQRCEVRVHSRTAQETEKKNNIITFFRVSNNLPCCHLIKPINQTLSSPCLPSQNILNVCPLCFNHRVISTNLFSIFCKETEILFFWRSLLRIQRIPEAKIKEYEKM
jgi:hypothetical protein